MTNDHAQPSHGKSAEDKFLKITVTQLSCFFDAYGTNKDISYTRQVIANFVPNFVGFNATEVK